MLWKVVALCRIRPDQRRMAQQWRSDPVLKVIPTCAPVYSPLYAENGGKPAPLPGARRPVTPGENKYWQNVISVLFTP